MSKKKKAVKVNLSDFLSSDIGGPPVVSEALPNAPRYARHYTPSQIYQISIFFCFIISLAAHFMIHFECSSPNAKHVICSYIILIVQLCRDG